MILDTADQRLSVNGLFTFDTNVNRKTTTSGYGFPLRKAASNRYCNVNAPLLRKTASKRYCNVNAESKTKNRTFSLSDSVVDHLSQLSIVQW